MHFLFLFHPQFSLGKAAFCITLLCSAASALLSSILPIHLALTIPRFISIYLLLSSVLLHSPQQGLIISRKNCNHYLPNRASRRSEEFGGRIMKAAFTPTLFCGTQEIESSIKASGTCWLTAAFCCRRSRAPGLSPLQALRWITKCNRTEEFFCCCICSPIQHHTGWLEEDATAAEC